MQSLVFMLLVHFVTAMLWSDSPPEQFATSEAAWKALEKLNPCPAGARTCSLLDVGAGDGSLAAYLRDRNGYSVKAYDFKPQAQTRDDGAPASRKKVNVNQFKGFDIPEHSKSFDVVSYIHLLHGSKFQADLLEAAARIARSYVIITEDLALTQPLDKKGENPKVISHTYEVWTKMFRDAGLDLVLSGPLSPGTNVAQWYFILKPSVIVHALRWPTPRGLSIPIKTAAQGNNFDFSGVKIGGAYLRAMMFGGLVLVGVLYVVWKHQSKAARRRAKRQAKRAAELSGGQ